MRLRLSFVLCCAAAAFLPVAASAACPEYSTTGTGSGVVTGDTCTFGDTERDGIKAAIAAMSLGADVVERHFTILPPEATKDGPVSIRPELLKQLVDFSKRGILELQEYACQEIPEYSAMGGQARQGLTPAEELNRDYYRGRFASRVGDQVVYNWEENPIF